MLFSVNNYFQKAINDYHRSALFTLYGIHNLVLIFGLISRPSPFHAAFQSRLGYRPPCTSFFLLHSSSSSPSSSSSAPEASSCWPAISERHSDQFLLTCFVYQFLKFFCFAHKSDTLFANSRSSCL